MQFYIQIPKWLYLIIVQSSIEQVKLIVWFTVIDLKLFFIALLFHN